MDLFDILSNNERVIVWSDDEGYIYTWNLSATFQQWAYRGLGAWEEVDIMTWGAEDIETIDDARDIARGWAIPDWTGTK